jgi:AcrR family transcriptional regulator
MYNIPAMARPVQAHAEATRQRILTGACAQFSAAGIDGTSMRDVAAAAGVNIATVHHYFGSKNGLAEACIDAGYEELGALKDAIAATMRPGRSFAGIVEDGVRAAYRFAVAHRAAHRMLLRIVVDADRLENVGRARRDVRSAEMLVEGARLLSAVTGRSDRDARLVVQSLSSLLTRWSLAPADELAVVVLGNASAASVEQSALHAAVEEHLIDLSFRILGLERPAPEDGGQS